MSGNSIVRWGLILGVGVGAVSVIPTAPAEARPPLKIDGQTAPPLEISEADLDMGDVAPRSKATKTVRLRNLGEEPVTVERTSGDCSCTALITDGFVVIKPGDDAELDIAVETRDMGIQTKKIRVFCTGFARPYEAIVRTNVTEAVEVNPGGIKAIVQPMGLLTLRSIDDRPFRVVSVHGEPPQFVGFVPEQDEPASDYRLVYDFSGMSKQDMPAVVVIETDHPDAPFVAIRNILKEPLPSEDGGSRPAGADRWRPDYDFEHIRRMQPGESVEMEIRLAKAGKAAREQALTVVSDNEYLTAEIAGVDLDSDAKWMKATVRVTASPMGEGFQAATLDFSLGDARTCQVQLFTRIVGG